MFGHYDMFSVVYVHIDHLKFCAVCIDGRKYVCCSKCNVASNECNERTSCLVQPIGTCGGEVMYFGCVCFRGELGFLNCDNICMGVVNKQFELIEFVFIPFMLTCSMMRLISLLLLGLCPCVVSVVMWSSMLLSHLVCTSIYLVRVDLLIFNYLLIILSGSPYTTLLTAADMVACGVTRLSLICEYSRYDLSANK